MKTNKKEFDKLMLKKPITEDNLDKFDYVMEAWKEKADLIDMFSRWIFFLSLGTCIVIIIYVIVK